ncbi:NAD(P)/FAD-dependent oxidoreductase [Pseudonocardia sp. MH-G8]|uniref:NAD(P)/FAD-dependent oxidoreductase n=1 Tax=Pseudonocardia sp. MH-G8 TaxID=1854588 RepID=UPI000BA0DF5E|nr:FAD-dependent oxidoreductase [Pseudonocardia sp. MH-G8]OZM83050.1 oxidoreductase [Pseudonocardia sp. MH-G8]
MTPHRIVVLGAGYAGQIVAKQAARRTAAQVTLVNTRDFFVERVRLHQLAAGQPLCEVPIRDLLRGTGVELVVDLATGIDAARRTVQLAQAEQPLPYDTLVYALGSQADTDGVAGAAVHAHTVAGPAEALALRDQLREASTVAVVGGGLTGIETAAELAENRPELKVRLVTSGLLGGALSQRGRRHLQRAFTRLGVDVQDHADVTAVRDDGVLLADGRHVAADTVVWTTGFRVPPLAAEAGFAVDRSGRMLVDATLRSVSHPEVYGVGDAAAAHRPGGQELRMACATGMPAASRAVVAISDRLAGREPRSLRFRYVNQCISLGRHDGLIQFVDADDAPREAVLTGLLAALYKEAIVRGALQAQRTPALLMGA